MEAEIQQQLDRVESALNALVDSITSYNPQPAAALSLLAADDELSGGVKRLAQHQANVQTLHQLRSSTTALDERIRSSMGLLADTRQDLLTNTPLTVSDPSSRSVDSKDILGYAQRIARFTVPPTYRAPLPAPTRVNVPLIKLEDQPTPANGLDSRHVSPPKEDPSPAYLNKTEGKAINALTAEQRAWLDPNAAAGAAPFMPWPSEDVIRSGALSRIQAALERDQDPARLDLTGAAPMEKPASPPPVEQVEPAKAPAAGPADQARPTELRRRESTRQPSKPKVEEEPGFDSFDLYDPDEE